MTMTLTRRQLAQHLLGGFALSAILPERRIVEAIADAVNGLEPPVGGRLLGTIPMRGVGRGPVDRRRGSGLGCRLPLDLSTLTEQTLITSNKRHFIRTACPANIDNDSPWIVRLRAGGDEAIDIPIESIEQATTPQGPVLMECSGNPRSYGFGLMSVAVWGGVPVLDLLEEHLSGWRDAGDSDGNGSEARGRILISGFDDHDRRVRGSAEGASWIFTENELRAAGAFLATRMNGESLPRDHGFPVRLIVPGWYGCTCVKWVNEIRIVGEDAPATSQMREFASRTHQRGRPRLAREYLPAEIDLCAMPVRVEQWEVEGNVEYRVAGIIWGGTQTTDRLMIRFHDDEPWQHVSSLDHRTNRIWTLWTHPWRPGRAGRYTIRLKVDDQSIRTRRLDNGYYRRTLGIDRV